MIGFVKSVLVGLTKPLVWRLAEAYDICINRPCYAYGQHPLVFKGNHEKIRNNIPKTVYFNTRSGSIVIGENTVFGEDVKVLSGKHMNVEEAHLHGVELHHVPEGGRNIVVGSGCYIGTGAILIGPIEIGDFAVIGAGAVVTKSIPPYTFAVGNPAMVIRILTPS